MLSKLFEPAQIGKMNLRNRIVMPPMVVNFANSDGSVSEDTKAYYAERAKGGVGLIIVEATAVARSGRSSPLQLSLYKDDFISGFMGLVDEIHRYGAKVAVQLVHCGRQGPSKFIGQQPIAPSAIPYAGGEMPRELRIDEIPGLIEDFAQAAARAKKAGFDAVEIHGAHGYLVGEFFSPRVNKRSDKYGGNLAGRAAFAIEMVERVKAALGNDFPILFRISADEYLPEGLILDEACVIAWMLQGAGVNCIDVSAGTHESLDMFVQPASFSPGCLVHLADAIKKVVNIPVITVGRIGDPLLAESILLQRKADLVAMGRALIADPELPNKARDGKLDEIRPCLACRLCLDRIFQKVKVSCAVNAGFGQEGKCVILPSKEEKKVLIIGGGPSGLEAARIAALRGHKVFLYEREEKLGGQLQLASVPPYKQGISSLTKFLIGQVTKLGVEIHVGQKGTLDMVSEIKPDAVVVATGNLPVKPDIPGIERPNVSLVMDVLSGKEKVGETVVIIGGGQVGCEAADFLATIGKKVTILARHDVAKDMEPLEKKPLLRRLRDKGVDIYTNTDIQEITERGVGAKANGRNIDFDTESIVVATGFIPNDELVKNLRRQISETYVIGDCVEPRKIHEAIHEGFMAGLKL